MPPHPRAVRLLALLALAACGGGGEPSDDEPSLAVVAGQNATAFAGNFSSVLPVVQVRNAAGAAVPGVQVTFAVAGGGGALAFPTAVSDAQGRASPGAWRFGPAGPQSLTATAAGYPTATINGTASAAPGSGAFTIDLRFLDPQPSDVQRAAFEAARARWQQIVLGDVTDFTGTIPAEPCGPDFVLPEVTSPVDDIVIFAGVRDIDGDNGILAQAGPCLVRGTSRLTIVGIVLFDVNDLDVLTSGVNFADVAFHEMGHALGFGTLWIDFDLLEGADVSETPFFTGTGARQAFAAVQDAANPFAGDAVPVEGTGGPGTRDGHWRESVFGDEIMTGFYDANATNLLSAVTIASLRDIGYVVDDARADGYVLAALRGAALRAGAATPLRESLAPWPIRALHEDGRLVPLRAAR